MTMFAVDSILGGIRPTYPPDNPQVVLYEQARQAAREQIARGAWRYSCDTEGTPLPGRATDIYRKEVAKVLPKGEDPCVFFNGMISSIKVVEKNTKKGPEVELRIVAQTSDPGPDASDEERRSAYDLLCLRLTSTEGTSFLDAAQSLQYRDQIGILCEFKTYVKRGKEYTDHLIQLYKCEGAEWVKQEAESTPFSDALDNARNDPSLKGLRDDDWTAQYREVAAQILWDMVSELELYKEDAKSKAQREAKANRPAIKPSAKTAPAAPPPRPGASRPAPARQAAPKSASKPRAVVAPVAPVAPVASETLNSDYNDDIPF